MVRTVQSRFPASEPAVLTLVNSEHYAEAPRFSAGVSHRLSNSHDGFHVLLILLSLDPSCFQALACAPVLVNKYAKTHDSMRIFIKSCVFVFMR